MGIKAQDGHMEMTPMVVDWAKSGMKCWDNDGGWAGNMDRDVVRLGIVQFIGLKIEIQEVSILLGSVLCYFWRTDLKVALNVTNLRDDYVE